MKLSRDNYASITDKTVPEMKGMNSLSDSVQRKIKKEPDFSLLYESVCVVSTVQEFNFFSHMIFFASRISNIPNPAGQQRQQRQIKIFMNFGVWSVSSLILIKHFD